MLDVLGFTPSGAPPGSGPDDYADSFTDTTHPFGAVTVGTPFAGMLQAIGDRDWFKVQLNAGTDYVINVTGQDGGGGGLDDPILTLHDASGAQIAVNDDADSQTFDSRLVIHPTAGGTFYVEVGSADDLTSGSFTVSVQAGVTVSTPGNDVMVAPAGGGTLMAGAGDDINGNQGNDTIHGNAGDDWVVGGKGDDSQTGDAGDDIVWGNLGNDTLLGGAGADQIRGGQGDDSLSGGSGNDFISGDRGNDTESGGRGADIFHGSQDAGIDKVLDFNYAEGDRVMLDPGATYTVSQVGADTVIDMGGGPNQMILVGVTLASLPTDWIFSG